MLTAIHPLNWIRIGAVLIVMMTIAAGPAGGPPAGAPGFVRPRELARMADGATPGAFGGLAFSPDGHQLALGWSEGIARIIAMPGGELLRALKSDRADGGRRVERPYGGLAFSPDGKALLTGSTYLALPDADPITEARDRAYHNVVRLWDAASGRPMRDFVGHEARVGSVAFHPDGSRVATGSFEGTVRIWDVATGREHLRFDGYGGKVYDVAFSSSGEQVAVSGEHGALTLDAETGREIVRLRTRNSVSCVAFSPDGRFLAIADAARSAQVWDLTTRTAAFESADGPLPPLEVPVSVAFTPDGERLLVGGRVRSRDQDGVDRTRVEIRAYDWRRGAVDSVTPLPGTWLHGFALSPDGQRLVTVEHDAARLWDVEPDVSKK